MTTLIDRYLARAIFVPFAGTLMITLMLLVLEEFARLTTVFARSAAPFTLAVRMLLYLLPEYMGVALPIALLLGILLAFRKLARSTELDVVGAVGIATDRMLLVPYLYALATACAAVAILGYLQPVASYEFAKLGFEADTGAIGAVLRMHEFTQLGPHVTLRVEGSTRDGRDLRGIFVGMEDSAGGSTIITAEQGRFLAARESGRLILQLENGRLIENSSIMKGPGSVTFNSLNVPLSRASFGTYPPRGDLIAHLTLTELLQRWRSRRASSEMRRAAFSELNGRLARSGIALLLPLLAVGLAIARDGADSSTGVLSGVLAIVGYEKLNQAAVTVEWPQGSLIAVWALFVCFALLSARVYWIVSRIPGGLALAVLERVARLARQKLGWKSSRTRS